MFLLQRGSGKTAVLVERVIKKIIDEKIDIDRLLIVTFTNAAASQMREKILKAIYKKLEENPENKYLQKQIVLINKANISTIHAFCLEIIRNHFYEIDLSPNFRMGDTSELELLKQEVIDDLFEEKYENEDTIFEKLIECYTTYRGDENLKDLVFRIDNFVQSMPFPKQWLNKFAEAYNVGDIEGFEKTNWGKILLTNLKETTNECYTELCKLEKKLLSQDLKICANSVCSDKNILSSFLGDLSWDDAHKRAMLVEFDDWKSDKIVSVLKKEALNERTELKKIFLNSLEPIRLFDSKESLKDISFMGPVINGLKDLVIEFENRYKQAKREKNIIDFNDIEHFALEILEKEDIAKEYREKFDEIAIDEYQDSNLIQDYLLNKISRGNNVFMVGDVKQCIYKFRQANPELFIEKYDSYGTEKSDGLKVLLYKNFRSRKEVIDLTNEIFNAIMSKKLGNIDYTEDEYLKLGAKYEPEEDESKKTELHIINIKKEKGDSEEIEAEITDKTEIEANFIAQKILELKNSKMMIKDEEEYRKLKFRDIVLLLKTPRDVATTYEKIFNSYGIPTYCEISSTYLETTEIATILSLLKIIDNPNQDIALVTTLRSPIYNFNDNELIKIRLFDRKGSFYEALEKASKEAEEPLKTKINSFFNSIDIYRKKQEYMPINELIWFIYETTGYMSYVSVSTNGAIKAANLKMLFERAKDYESASFKGLYNFIHYIERMKNIGQDFGGAKIIGENEDVVRIMSIHKSKGLEFPVVFIGGLGKEFNQRDVNEKVLLHQDEGFGLKIIDYERKIEYDTLAKEALKNVIKQDETSEEMRVLYVGLTRAKEKLILVGTQKEAEEEISKKKTLIQVDDENKIPAIFIKKYKSFIDWIELVYIKSGMNIQIHLPNELNVKQLEIESENDIKSEKLSDDEKKKIEKEINWKYPNEELSSIPSKTSVTAIKNIMQKEEVKECELMVPEFIQEEKALTGAKIGTTTHLVLQKLDLKKNYTSEELKEFISELVFKKLINEKEKESIKISQIEKFLSSNLIKDIRAAKLVYKEKPFYLYVPAKEIYGGLAEEKVVVQGIIDLYYTNSEDELVLVDYKTDYVNDEKELITKYKDQLDIYQKALEDATKQKVARKYIFSLYLGKEILVT